MAAPQYAILRFAKYKESVISSIEAHNERTKENYASNPDVDPSRTHLNFLLINSKRKYRVVYEKQISEAGCRHAPTAFMWWKLLLPLRRSSSRK